MPKQAKPKPSAVTPIDDRRARIDDRRARILAALETMRGTLTNRRALFHLVPRRGYPSTPPPPSPDLIYHPQNSGGAEVLRQLSAGNLELITARLLDELIAELS